MDNTTPWMDVDYPQAARSSIDGPSSIYPTHQHLCASRPVSVCSSFINKLSSFLILVLVLQIRSHFPWTRMLTCRTEVSKPPNHQIWSFLTI